MVNELEERIQIEMKTNQELDHFRVKCEELSETCKRLTSQNQELQSE